jgi:hypothetical protein
VFLAGQVPRLPARDRLGNRSFEEQARQTLASLDGVARVAGGTLVNAVKVNVYMHGLADGARDACHAEYFGGEARPAQTSGSRYSPTWPSRRMQCFTFPALPAIAFHVTTREVIRPEAHVTYSCDFPDGGVNEY